jgi:hypothetical protein
MDKEIEKHVAEPRPYLDPFYRDIKRDQPANCPYPVGSENSNTFIREHLFGIR